MVRIPNRRTHSVSGPPSAHSVFKDVACCCNIVKIQHFYLSIMAIRRNPHRKCKKEDTPLLAPLDHDDYQQEGLTGKVAEHRKTTKKVTNVNAKRFRPPPACATSLGPFPFFEFPREVRDLVYSYLVVPPGRGIPLIEAKSILRDQKKRASTQRTRERLNLKRAQTGRRLVTPRESTVEPLVHLNILQASRLLQREASDYFYQHNLFAMSIENLPSTAIETPHGWAYSRIAKMQLELQLKDAQRMNSYVDWASFFAQFPGLRVLRIIPTFHARYYDWAHSDLIDWSVAHYVFRAFFRELLASIPESLALKLGPSLNPQDDMHLEGQAAIGKDVLCAMYAELGARRDMNGSGRIIATTQIVDCGGIAATETRGAFSALH